MHLHQMSNDELLESLTSIAANERQLVTKVLVYLIETEKRGLHFELAFKSLHDFCVRKLALSEAEAYRRVAAARLVRRFPALLTALASGQIHLTTLAILKDLFTESNLESLIEQAAGKTKRQVLSLAADLAPKPDIESRVRKLPEPRAPARSETETAASSFEFASPSPVQLSPPQIAVQAAPKRNSLSPLGAKRFAVQFTASAELVAKLEYAKSLMSHRNSSEDLANVVEQAVALLVEKLEKERLGKTSRPQTKPRPALPSRITNATRREVTSRDKNQCSFVSESGDRCPAESRLELDHRHPKARGGTSGATNVRILCRAHNLHEAKRVFGRAHIEKKIEERQRKIGSHL